MEEPYLASQLKKSEVGELIKEIKLLREKIDNLEKEVKESNTTLVNHINFINTVYDNIKRPLLYVMNKVSNSFLIGDQEPVQ